MKSPIIDNHYQLFYIPHVLFLTTRIKWEGTSSLKWTRCRWLSNKSFRLTSTIKSFFPRAIALWNNLPKNIKGENSFDLFRSALSKKETNVIYYYGKRWPSVHHSRMRLGCSKLKFDLCNNLHVSDSENCSCGAKRKMHSISLWNAQTIQISDTSYIIVFLCILLFHWI